MSNWKPQVGMLVKKVSGNTERGKCPIGYTTTITEAGRYTYYFTVICPDGTGWMANIDNWVPVHTKHELNSPAYNNLYE